MACPRSAGCGSGVSGQAVPLQSPGTYPQHQSAFHTLIDLSRRPISVDEPWPRPHPHQPSQIEKHLLIHSHWTRGIVQVIFLSSSWPRCQLDFVPINCLQSDANGHKLLLRQPRHFASLTYSSLSIFFPNANTQKAHTPCPCASY